MKLGLFGVTMGRFAAPEVCAQAARTAEAAGFESIWTGEHVCLPDPRTKASPLAPQHPTLEPVVAFAWLAAATRTIKLGTGIVILPQRNPVVLAKELATLDVLSGGRLIFGLGVGYLPEEFAAVGVPFAERGARTDENLAAIKALWTMAKPAYQGRFVRFSGIDAQPRPAQKLHPPVVVGGWSEAAFRRAARSAQGWYGFNMDVAATARHLATLKRILAETDRPAELGPLEISISPPGRAADAASGEPGLDADEAKRYRDLGVDRLIVHCLVRDAAAIPADIEAMAERLRPAL
jgi:probable F420-dependent oxidoreductase